MAVPWFVCCLFLIAAALAVFVVRRRSNPRGESREPACGQCGYAVRGLPTFTCPECGSDLREVGIITPQGPQAASRVILVLLWSLCVIVFAVPITSLIEDVVPQRKFTSVSFNLSEPRSGAYDHVAVNVRQHAPAVAGISMQEGQATFDLASASGITNRLEVDLPGLGYRYTNSNGDLVDEASGLRVSDILEWMGSAGVDAGSEAVQVEAAQLMSVAGAAARGDAHFAAARQPGFGRMGASTLRAWTVNSAPWLMPVVIVFWVIVWVLGAWRILRRGRSRASA